MSLASERKAIADVLPEYALLSIPKFAAFLGCSEDVARQMVEDGVVPSVTVGKRKHVDPIDAAVYFLAEREGITAAAYWEKNGEATVDHVRRLVARIRKVA